MWWWRTKNSSQNNWKRSKIKFPWLQRNKTINLPIFLLSLNLFPPYLPWHFNLQLIINSSSQVFRLALESHGINFQLNSWMNYNFWLFLCFNDPTLTPQLTSKSPKKCFQFFLMSFFLLFLWMINWVPDVYSSLLMAKVFLNLHETNNRTFKHEHTNNMLRNLHRNFFDTKASHSFFCVKVFCSFGSRKDFPFQKIFIRLKTSLRKNPPAMNKTLSHEAEQFIILII